MKEATGETSMTMITIAAVAVIAGILALVWPRIQTWINTAFNPNMQCPNGYTLQADGSCQPPQ